MTQGELEQVPQQIVNAMNELEVRIMEDMVRRIRINGFSTASADWQFKRLQQLGLSEEEIKKWVQDTLDVSDAEIDRIYSDDVYEEYMGHRRAYDAYGRQQIPFDENQELQQLIEGIKQQTKDELEKITGSMGFVIPTPSGNLQNMTLTEYYQKTLDDAMYDISSGAFDYNTVLGRTINEMTNSGIRWIDYSSGHHNRIPVAARRAVMTGFRQVQGKINEQTARELGTDSYEVTVHIGARPTHQVWEGKVWTMEELRSVCGLGSVTGLHGVNCYHDYNAFIPGVSTRTYTDEELQRIHDDENKPKTYNGKEYTTYEALQHQRQLETRARKYREDVHLLEEGEGSEDDIIAKKCRYQKTLQEYRTFSDKMDLPMQKERIYQDGLSVDMRAPKKQRGVNLTEKAESKKESTAPSQQISADYASGDTFANHDNRLTAMLISGDTSKAATAVNEILNGEEYGLPDSKWSGVVNTLRYEDAPGIYGRKEWNCDISIREDRVYDLKTYIHENLHSRSISRIDPKDQLAVYANWRQVEEGTIEYLTQAICNKCHITCNRSYTLYVDSLRDIQKIVSPKLTEYDYAKNLIAIPLDKRYNEIENTVNKYFAETQKVRESVRNRLIAALENLKGGMS